MTLQRVYAVICEGDGCDATLTAPAHWRRIDLRDVDKFRRWTRRAGWRRARRHDLCPACAVDERRRARLARRPVGMF